MSLTRRHRRPLLTRGGLIPLHRQLADILRRDLTSGRYRPDERIPSERVLCATYEVSRTTVRQTVNELVHEGRLIRVPARGTFVTPSKIEQDLARVTRFSETVTAIGRQPRIRILSSQRMAPPDGARHALELPPGADVLRLEVVGYADAEPLVYYRVHLPADIGRPIVARLVRAQESGKASFNMILEQLKQIHGLTAARAVQSYEAALADHRGAELLDIRPRSPVIASTRIIYTDNELPVEYDEILYRGDRYRFTIRRIYALT